MRSFGSDQHKEGSGRSGLILDEAQSPIFEYVGRVIRGLMTEVDKLAIFADRVVERANLCEGITEVPAWRHQGAWIWTANPNPSAHGCRPISKSFFLRGFVLAVAIHIFADQRRFVAHPLEPTRQVICFIAPECRPATALGRLV